MDGWSRVDFYTAVLRDLEGSGASYALLTRPRELEDAERAPDEVDVVVDLDAAQAAALARAYAGWCGADAERFRAAMRDRAVFRMEDRITGAAVVFTPAGAPPGYEWAIQTRVRRSIPLGGREELPVWFAGAGGILTGRAKAAWRVRQTNAEARVRGFANGAFGALLRLEVHRRWRRRSRKLAGAALLAGMALQEMLTYLDFRMGVIYGFDHWGLRITRMAGLSSGVCWVWLRERAYWAHSLEWPTASLLDVAVAALSAAASVAGHLLLPAWAAFSIAPDRQQGKLGELLAAGYRPGQILVAKGLAAVLPFALLMAASEVVGLPLSVWRALNVVDGNPVWQVVGTVTDAAGSALQALCGAAVLVSISALCRRPGTALALCYLAEFAVLPLLAWPLRHQPLLAFGVMLLATAAVVALALRALRYAEE